MNVYQKLNEARAKFHSMPLTKTGENKFAGYKYFELGDFLIPALGVFREVGLCAVVSFESETAYMHIRCIDKPDDAIIITSPMGSAALKGCHEVQNIGAVETYQRRYLWVAALEIVEHDALDAATGSKEPEAKRKEPEAKRKPLGVAADYLELHPVPDDEQPYLIDLAREVCAIFDQAGAGEAYARIQMEELDDPQRVFLAQQMPSATRNKIKAHSQALRQTEKA